MKIICTGCGHEVPTGALGVCPKCAGILQPVYPSEVIEKLSRMDPGPGIDRYRELFPISGHIPYLGEGDTPLIASRRLGSALGLESLYFKYEGSNPSGSFKDRAGALVAALALEAGSKGVLTASSGNAAAAISAYAAAVGLKCLILLEPGSPPTKLRQVLAMGAEVLSVEGIFTNGPDKVAKLILQVAKNLCYYPAFVWAPVNPYILEGIKSISYEIFTRLPGPPDVVVCPVGGGDMFTAQWRGYLELKRAGLMEKLPRMIAVQSVDASPLLNAFESHLEHVNTLSYANSKISGINVAFSGDHALKTVRDSGGVVVGVEEEDVFSMQQRLGAEEGLWVEPVSAAPPAALSALLSKGTLRPNESVVCIMSGAGFKDLHLARERAEAVSKKPPVPFDAQAITNHVTG